MAEPRTIAIVRKNNMEEVRVSVTVQQGYALVDMRIFAASARSQGEPCPTPRGICLTRAKLPELIRALQAAEREASR
ncbi:hypothetical protein J2X36_005294 [Methylobacterium sp. BE186]|uniref:hypothetical protein n=1 Tax=Methylobacterium sp. BE186 TaxID=2817715 RepID=UPI0028644092|nr:hypothetical protein [Methylobacterium sp. BE186]MDR7040511.1 hypothetical protein [Methylobacterium sp. BE186]